jgi:hypothetical protein
MSEAIKQAIDALEVAKRDAPTLQDTIIYERALAALRAQPVESSEQLSEEQILWIARSHGINVPEGSLIGFCRDLISTTPAQPDHSELIARLRCLNPVGDSFQYICKVTNEAADALEGK